MPEVKITVNQTLGMALLPVRAKNEYRKGVGAIGKTIRMESPGSAVLPSDERPWTVPEAATF